MQKKIEVIGNDAYLESSRIDALEQAVADQSTRVVCILSGRLLALEADAARQLAEPSLADKVAALEAKLAEFGQPPPETPTWPTNSLPTP